VNVEAPAPVQAVHGDPPDRDTIGNRAPRTDHPVDDDIGNR
jgi:hypothetical protein